jgi:hypothetical protein
MAFRSVPRPSSPPGAKASTERPSHAHRHADFRAHALNPHLAQEPSNHSLERLNLSPTLCRPAMRVARTTPIVGRTRHQAHPSRSLLPNLRLGARNPSKETVSTPLNTLGCGDSVFPYLLRSDMQPMRADAPNPDSQFKRTLGMEDPIVRRQPVHTRDHRSAAFQHAAQCSHDT